MSDLKNKHEMVVDIMTQVATIATKLGIVHNNNEDENKNNFISFGDNSIVVHFLQKGYGPVYP